jgi:hypothetical protein
MLQETPSFTWRGTSRRNWNDGMRRIRPKIVASIGACLLLVATGGANVAVAAALSNNARERSIACGRNATNNTPICNFGRTPEQLKQLTEAAVRGAQEPLIDQVVRISGELGTTEGATKTLLRIVGKHADIFDDRLAAALSNVANDYKQLQAQASMCRGASLALDFRSREYGLGHKPPRRVSFAEPINSTRLC